MDMSGESRKAEQQYLGRPRRQRVKAEGTKWDAKESIAMDTDKTIVFLKKRYC